MTRLLITTQALDKNDPVLGFFHAWVAALAPRFEGVEVICLREGNHTLSENVRVHSLGKEEGEKSRLGYALRFLRLAWQLRHDYDAVFVHMNQEYVLLAGWLWNLLGKRIYMWRNHYQGSWLTDLAAALCTKVFCTSKHSYTANYAKTVIMPVGVDMDRFHTNPCTERKPNSILFLARMAPSKRPEMLLEALGLLKGKGTDFTAMFCGSPLPRDEAYYEGLRAKAEDLGIGNRVAWMPARANDETPDLYRAHELFVNCSPSGMFDKTIFEAAACGCRVLAASDDWKAGVGERYWFDTAPGLAEKIEACFAAPEADTAELRFAERSGLSVLADRLAKELY